MSKSLFEFSAQLRLRSNGTSPASRHFVTVEKNVSQKIQEIASTLPRKGWGSVKVEVRIGFYMRKTSIFPDKNTGCYLLPIKSEARSALQIGAGDDVLINLTLI